MLSKCPAAMSFLELHFWRWGGRGGIEFQRNNICLNEFRALLMLRKGVSIKAWWHWQRDYVGVRFCRWVCFICVHVAVQLLGSRRQRSTTWSEKGQGQSGVSFFVFVVLHLFVVILCLFIIVLCPSLCLGVTLLCRRCGGPFVCLCPWLHCLIISLWCWD